ncbi:MAG: DUF3662 domain-containing protein [Actinomycetota bacterium]|nr:DUF3662 domain-containing protein [Actinomycetota bacterium]
MPNLRDFERRLGQLVEGLFSKTFRSGVQPIEIAKLVLKEMDAGRTVGVSEVWAPNHFEITTSEDDGKRFDQARSAMIAELRRLIRENADERGWGLLGPPEVELSVDPSMKKGDLVCVATLVEGEERIEPAAPSAAAMLDVHEDGQDRTVSLKGDVVTIGRNPDCDVVLKDKAASRHHAQIKATDGHFTLTDLGSTNGTRLNGQTIQSRVLEDGDRITIGATTLDFRRS